jgi:hypothetical protein
VLDESSYTTNKRITTSVCAPTEEGWHLRRSGTLIFLGNISFSFLLVGALSFPEDRSMETLWVSDPLSLSHTHTRVRYSQE